MYLDEVASARIISRGTLSNVLTEVRASESTPPLWYGIAWAVHKLDRPVGRLGVSTPIERLRLLSVMFAGLAVALTTRMAARFLPPLLAALVGAMLALGSTPLAYAEQLRAYALLMFLSIAFAELLTKALESPRPRVLGALALTTWAGTMTHYFFFLLIGGAAIWLALESRQHAREWRRVAASLAIGVLGFGLWAPGFLDQYTEGHFRWIGAFEARRAITVPGALFFGADGVLFAMVRVGVLAACAAGCYALWRLPRGRAVIALAAFPVVATCVFWALGFPIFTERNLLVAAPSIAILAAAGVSVLPTRAVVPVAALALGATFASALALQLDLGRTDARGVARALLSEGWSKEDAVLVSSERPRDLTVPVGWYLPGHPELRRVDAGRTCLVSYRIVAGPEAQRWLAAHRADVLDSRRLTSYDHPVEGRRDGFVVVARTAPSAGVPGEVFARNGVAPGCGS